MFTAPCKPCNRPHRQRRIAAAREKLPTSAVMVQRIEAVYGQATADEHLDGRAWYSAARAIADIVASALKLSPSHGAGIVAALSPQCGWDENIVRALALADGDHVGGLADGLAKAERIAAGEHPGSVLGGRKVRSFWRNIVGHESHVTIDRHAVAVVFDRALDDTEIKVLERCGAYTVIAGAYRTVARRHSISASTLQATTWLTWRRIKRIGLGLEDLDF